LRTEKTNPGAVKRTGAQISILNGTKSWKTKGGGMGKNGKESPTVSEQIRKKSHPRFLTSHLLLV